uniref:Uncharacterized protein n=1 Tax=Triticum urartu TaxID=4572 RepID=A0A8R7TLG6_TRIUA
MPCTTLHICLEKKQVTGQQFWPVSKHKSRKRRD